MNILVVNGRKINSYALTLESAAFFASNQDEVSFVDLNLLGLPWSTRSRIQKEIKAKFGIRNSTNTIIAQVNLLRAAREAKKWCVEASKSENAWKCTALNGKLPLGRLVRSLIARSMGTSNFELSDCAKTQVYEIAFKSILSYLQTVSAIEKSSRTIDLGVAHGGRDAYSAGAICAFRNHGITTRLVESGGIPSRWSLFVTSPHYSPDFWTRLEESELKKFSSVLIDNWWAARLAGSDHFRTEEWGHTREQNLLPNNLPREYISFFTTSDFEIPVFEDFDVFPGEFLNQTQAFLALYKICEINNIHLVVRRHPNSVDQLRVDREIPLWLEIRNLPGVTYLGPHEKIDSIALAKGSRTVFTFKSSVGIEAIWLGVPAFALGPARWAWAEDLRAWDSKSLESAVLNPKAADRSHSIRWANMMLEMDYPNSQFDEIHGNHAVFNSKVVQNSNFSNYVDKLLGVLLEKLMQNKIIN